MLIHENFTGGNIVVKSQEENVIYLDNNLRDTTCEWFYWAFCIEGAEGRTLTFRFRENRLGYFGPAVSHDLETWHWLNEKEGDSFCYTFSGQEEKVYFAHDMLYHPGRFRKFAHRHGVKIKTLTLSQKGRPIPCVEMGDGNRKIVLTARHHACESTGSYVLEGVLEELLREPIEGFGIFCVPFVDYDGVVDGDQGKNRFPHDHNRDYQPEEKAIYPSVAEIRRYVLEHPVVFGFDFHSPYHCGGVGDKCFIVQKRKEELPLLNRFGELLEACMTSEAFPYAHENDYPPDFGWNKSTTPTFASFVLEQPSSKLAFTLETAYFGTREYAFTQERGVETGRCFARALRQYVREIV